MTDCIIEGLEISLNAIIPDFGQKNLLYSNGTAKVSPICCSYADLAVFNID